MMTWTLVIFMLGSSEKVEGFKTQEACSESMTAIHKYWETKKSSYLVGCYGPVYMDVKPAEKGQAPKQ